MKTDAKVKKWGNSLAIRIPRRVAEELGLADDSDVQISTSGNAMTVKPGPRRAKMTLEELLKGVTPQNVHGEFDLGADVGAERWYEQD